MTTASAGPRGAWRAGPASRLCKNWAWGRPCACPDAGTPRCCCNTGGGGLAGSPCFADAERVGGGGRGLDGWCKKQLKASARGLGLVRVRDGLREREGFSTSCAGWLWLCASCWVVGLEKKGAVMIQAQGVGGGPADWVGWLVNCATPSGAPLCPCAGRTLKVIRDRTALRQLRA